MIEAWDSCHEVVRAMEASDDFEPIVISIPRHFNGDSALGFEGETHRGLEHEKVTHLRLTPHDMDQALRFIQALEPDLIFRQSQWDADISEELASERLGFARTGLIPYETMNIVQNVPNEHSTNSAVDSPYHRDAWVVFCTNDLMLDMARRDAARGGTQFRIAGHPKADRLRAASADWPVASGASPVPRRRIAWSAHHSIGTGWTEFGAFPLMADDMLAWARDSPDLEFVLLPHPALIPFLGTQPSAMTRAEFDRWREAWLGLPNTMISSNGGYASVLAASELLITDGLSLLVEYQLFERPLIFFERDGHRPFNEIGDIVRQGAHPVKTVTEARALTERFLAGEADPLAARQREITRRLFGDEPSAGRILSILREMIASERASGHSRRSPVPTGIPATELPMRETSPTFSLITAVYQSAPYLPEYLDSLAELDIEDDDVEMLFVSDGSPDESERIIETWIAATGAHARLIRKDHGGSASARNVGLAFARGTWVSFPDPDDVLGRGYLGAVRRFLDGLGEEESNVSVVATKVVQFTDCAANAVDNHILGYRYHGGSRCVHLEREPRFFHTHAPSGFYRRALIEKAGLRLDVRLAVAFEDAAFAADYMLAVDDPVVGVVPDAVYAYRRRPDSVIGTMWSKPGRYTTVVEHGYLRLLRCRARPPLWLQNLVLYDLIWFFYEYEQPGSPNRAIDRDVANAFLALLDEVLTMIDERTISAYSLHPLPLHLRTALVARKCSRLARPHAHLVGSDRAERRIRVSYFALPGQPPERNEVITIDGIVRPPLEATTRPIEYYGQTFLMERELLLDASGTVTIEVDGEILPLTASASGTGPWFPWEHEPPSASDADGTVPSDLRAECTPAPPRPLGIRLGSLARNPRRIGPALDRRAREAIRRVAGIVGITPR